MTSKFKKICDLAEKLGCPLAGSTLARITMPVENMDDLSFDLKMVAASLQAEYMLRYINRWVLDCHDLAIVFSPYPTPEGVFWYFNAFDMISRKWVVTLAKEEQLKEKLDNYFVLEAGVWYILNHHTPLP